MGPWDRNMGKAINAPLPTYTNRCTRLSRVRGWYLARDVTVTSRTTRFCMNDFVFYSGVRQCCHRAADACAAADPRVRDRFPPWDREFFYEKHFKISKLF